MKVFLNASDYVRCPWSSTLSFTCRYNVDPEEIRDELVWAEYKMVTDNEKETLCVTSSKQARRRLFYTVLTILYVHTSSHLGNLAKCMLQEWELQKKKILLIIITITTFKLVNLCVCVFCVCFSRVVFLWSWSVAHVVSASAWEEGRSTIWAFTSCDWLKMALRFRTAGFRSVEHLNWLSQDNLPTS